MAISKIIIYYVHKINSMMHVLAAFLLSAQLMAFAFATKKCSSCAARCFETQHRPLMHPISRHHLNYYTHRHHTRADS